MPHELAFFGVFLSPWLAAFAGASVLVPLTSRLFGLCGLELPGRQWAMLLFFALYACALFRWGM
ncbi:MAG: hypothetical protein IJB53_07285 [Mailhella sp.]|nr:hypothetical protein [Mailhella sp.]